MNSFRGIPLNPRRVQSYSADYLRTNLAIGVFTPNEARELLEGNFAGKERSLVSKPTEKQVEEFGRKWEYWTTCTKPANRSLAERAIHLLRKSAGFRTPPIFIWCDSPFIGRALCDFLYKRSRTYDLSSTTADSEFQRAKIRIPTTWSSNPTTWRRIPSTLADSSTTLDNHITNSDTWGYHLKESREERWDYLTDGYHQRTTAHLTEGIEEELWDTIFRSVPRERVQELVSSSLLAAHKGQLDTSSIMAGLTARDLYDDPKPSQLQYLRRWEALAKSCQYWWCYKNYVIISERFERVILEVHTETDSFEGFNVGFRRRVRRLHCTTGPAIRYRDGRCIYAIANVRVPDLIVEAPQKITIRMIDQQPNAEVRRHMIDRFRPEPQSEYHGAAAYIRESGAARISHDERYGTLWRRDFPDDEPILMLEVVNRSPEPDGHYKHYFLRVPPHVTDSHEAAAWTFNMNPEDYEPIRET